MEQAANVVDVPLGQRVIQTLVFHVLLDRFLRGTLSKGVAGRNTRIGERHKAEHKQRDTQCHDGQRDEASSDKAQKVIHFFPLYIPKALWGARVEHVTRAPHALISYSRPSGRSGCKCLRRCYSVTVAQSMKDMPVVPMPLKPSMRTPSPLGVSRQEAVTVLTWSTGYRTACSAIMSKHLFQVFC